MNLWIYLLAITAFFVGIFLGYKISKEEGKIKSKQVWSRLQRRNIVRTINALVSAIDFKDHLTRSHSDNVKHYASVIAKKMGMPDNEIDGLKEACKVHDLGKIGVHDNILTKPDKLNEQEYKEMKLHSLAGAVILKPFYFLDKVVKMVRQHHERYDGKGYPDDLKERKSAWRQGLWQSQIVLRQ
ncbi:MAG: HD domain-containing phosphohydrolase [Candidatus Omnitrophota bacterium]